MHQGYCVIWPCCINFVAPRVFPYISTKNSCTFIISTRHKCVIVVKSLLSWESRSRMIYFKVGVTIWKCFIKQKLIHIIFLRFKVTISTWMKTQYWLCNCTNNNTFVPIHVLKSKNSTYHIISDDHYNVWLLLVRASKIKNNQKNKETSVIDEPHVCCTKTQFFPDCACDSRPATTRE